MNKKERKELIRDLLDMYATGVLFSPIDALRLNSLTGWNGVAFKKVINPRNPTDTHCLSISLDGIKFEVWSWLKSPALTDNAPLEQYNIVFHRTNVLRALRSAVQHQMETYRVAAIPKDAGEASCVHCGTFYELTVDHKTTPFIDIANAFLEGYSKVMLENPGDGSGWRLKDGGLLLFWLDFHMKYADYQLLCRSCNSKKSSVATV